MLKEKHVTLTSKERTLLLSFFFFGVASPIFFLFSNTFLWRENASPFAIIIYNVGLYLGVSLGFIANRALLLKLSAQKLYALSCILQGISPLLLVSIAPKGVGGILALGVYLGISMGLYYANRNFFTSLITYSKNRFSFISLDQTLGIVGGIISPLLVGGYITFAIETQHISSLATYSHVALFGFVFLILSATTIRMKTADQKQTTRNIFIKEASPLWQKIRAMDFVGGLVSGICMTLPLLIALVLLKGESSVGTMKSTAALVGGLSLYLFGKYRSKIPHGWLMAYWVIGSAIAGGIIAYSYSAWGVVLAALVSALVGPFQAASTSHIMYAGVEKENPNERANFLLDREIFLNTGRIAALALCAVMLFVAPSETLRYGYLCATALHILHTILLIRAQKALQKDPE